jgi:hypothetical protein
MTGMSSGNGGTVTKEAGTRQPRAHREGAEAHRRRSAGEESDRENREEEKPLHHNLTLCRSAMTYEPVWRVIRGGAGVSNP